MIGGWKFPADPQDWTDSDEYYAVMDDKRRDQEAFEFARDWHNDNNYPYDVDADELHASTVLFLSTPMDALLSYWEVAA